MRLGIRAQLVLSIAALLVVALAPLIVALSTVARASLLQSWQRSSHALGRAIAGHVNEARRSRSPAELQALLDAQLSHTVGAIGVYDSAGTLRSHAGSPNVISSLPQQVAAEREQVIEVTTGRGPAMVVLIPGHQGPVGALLHIDPSSVRVAPLVQLVALYTGLLGLGLLVVAYFGLTRLVVAPIEELSRAASRVADGARQLNVPRRGGRELVDLGTSLAQMTERLRAEEQALLDKVDEVEAATETLRRAQDTLIRSERLASVGRLAAGLAHEIGNPITAMLGLLELLREGGLEPDEQRDFLARITHETERVHRVLQDLLTFARPAVQGDADGRADAAARTSVREAVDHVVALVGPQKSFADVEVRTSLSATLPLVTMGASQIEQLLLNLVLNSADVVPKPGGLVTIEAQGTDQTVRITIEDNGGGVAPSVRARIFEPFVTTKEPGKGTGLGLAVCRGLVEAAGGRIDVEDGADGARFILDLPRARAEPD